MNAKEAKRLALDSRGEALNLQLADIKRCIRAAAVAGRFSCEYHSILPENINTITNEGYIIKNNINTKFVYNIYWD